MYTITFTVPNLDILTKLADAVKATGLAETPPERASKPKPVKEEAAIPIAAKKADTGSDKELKENVNNVTAKLADISRDTAIAVLKRFGASRVPELKSEHYADYIRAANDVLESQKDTSLI